MIKNTLIILLILIAVVYYCYSYTETFTGNSVRMNQVVGNRKKDIEKTIEVHHSSAIEVGADEDDNRIFQFKGKMFKLNENNVLEPTNSENITYKKVHSRIPITITENQIKSKLPLNFNGFTFTGMLNNSYYKQYYLLYEKEYTVEPDMKNFNEKLYSYILAKYKNDTLEVIHNIPPRSRVTPGDNVYFSFGNFQLGPLIFV
jgi:hypothetical protein